MHQTGFVLSGGGARGFAHLGILHYMNEQGITPDIISGVSAGAIAGVFIAAGIAPLEAHKILSKGGFLKYTKMQLPTTGLLRLDGLKELLAKEIPYKNLEELPVPFYAATTNLTKGRVEHFDKGPIEKVVMASSSIPVLFSPIEINTCQYVDGGVLNNLPLEPLEGKCKQVITINIHPVNETGKLKNLTQVAMRTFHLGVNRQVEEIKKKSTLYIEPKELYKYDLLKAGKADEIFELGYNYAKSIDMGCLK